MAIFNSYICKFTRPGTGGEWVWQKPFGQPDKPSVRRWPKWWGPRKRLWRSQRDSSKKRRTSYPWKRPQARETSRSGHNFGLLGKLVAFWIHEFWLALKFKPVALPRLSFRLCRSISRESCHWSADDYSSDLLMIFTVMIFMFAKQ